MKTLVCSFAFVGLLIALTGCQMTPQSVTPVPSSYAARATPEPSVLETSLFRSDQAVLGDEAIARILSSKLELPSRLKISLMKFPDTRFYREDFRAVQQEQIEALSRALVQSDTIREVTALPSLMTPRSPSISVLREAAVRMQADLLLVFRVSSDAYARDRTFTRDKAKAYSTCEMVLLDVRTGLVPFTTVVSRERLEDKRAEDLDLWETTRRAEKLAGEDSLKAAAQRLTDFIEKIPRKAG